MSRAAFVFPGQGSQYVGMGRDIWEQSSEGKKFFERADELLGFQLSKVCFEGPEDELKQTRNTQPALFVHSLALTQFIKDEFVYAVAGHSLGEYTALVYAGAFSFEDGLRLVRLRAELMQRACLEQPGTMAAIIGLDAKVVGEICCKAWTTGIVQAANFNSPGQIVISGAVAGVRKAMEMAKERGARMVKELSVSGAFHSPLMESTRAELSKALEQIEIREAGIPVYVNISGLPITRPGEIREALTRQLTNPVRWEDSIRNMIADGITRFVEIGAGKVLQGLIRRVDAAVDVAGIERLEDLNIVQRVKE